jgi:hypothetical protein
MPSQRLEFYARREAVTGHRVAITLYKRYETDAGQVIYSVGQSVVIAPLDRNVWTPPTFEVEPEEAQNLMDELWRCGLRPTEGTGSAGSLAATERHLKDMRALVAKSHGIDWK